MKASLALETWLQARSSELFGRSEAPSRISVVRRGQIFDASVEFSGGLQRIIVKQFLGSCFDVSEFIQTHEKLIAANPAIADFTPKFLACHNEKKWIAMQYVAGNTLEHLIFLALGGDPPALANCELVLKESGRLLAEFHQVAAGDIGFSELPRDNRSFLSAFRDWLDHFRWQLRLMGVNRQRLKDLVGHFPEEMLNRLGSQVVPVDAQPKNILVGSDGRPHFIDLAYSVGNPALGAALFLASVDRLRARRPWARASLFSRFRNAFLSGYLRHLPDEVRSDLALFYPWALLYTMHRHRKAHPIKGSIAGLLYAKTLAEYVAASNHLLEVTCVFPAVFSSVPKPSCVDTTS